MPRKNAYSPKFHAGVWLIGCLVVATLTSFGCGPNAPPESPPQPETGLGATAEVETALDQAWSEESWEAHYIDGSKIGHGRLRVREITEDGRKLREFHSESKMSIRRFQQTVEQDIHLLSVETPKGNLVRFETIMDGATTRGYYREGKLHLTTVSTGTVSESSIDWNAEYGGFFADRQSMRRQPLQPGERRTIRALVPVIHQLGVTELAAESIEDTQLLSGNAALLRVNSSVVLGPITIQSALWVDAAGTAQKATTSLSGFEQTTYVVPREVALGAASTNTFDLGVRSVVAVATPIDRPHQTEVVSYEVTLSGGRPAEIFESGVTQAIQQQTEETAKITVRAIRPETQIRVRTVPPTADDLAPNSLIQAADPAIVEMAATVAGSEPWEVAIGLEQLVHRTVRSRAFSQALASASEVAATRAGDCTEHAVLLAALCRARKIPARVAIGLVYFQQGQGFAYHMWNEVWIQDRWIPLDATLGLGGIGAAHLKVATSDLAGATPHSALLPVLDILGKLQLRILEQR